MAKQKVGDLIREARAKAGLSQETLAKQIEGLSATDVSKAERGEKELTQAQLKAIAKATGVTQKSLLEAAGSTAKKSASSGSKKTTDAGKKATSGSSAKKSSGSSGASVKVTAAEKKLLELYRAADADTKKAAISLLKGEKLESEDGILGSILGTAMDVLTNLKK